MWRLYKALTAILERPFITSKQMEVIIGHFTFIALCRRPLLSVMHAVYRFASAGVLRRQKLSTVAVRELTWMRDLHRLCFASLGRPPSPLVTASDASFDGQGVVAAAVDVQTSCRILSLQGEVALPWC